MLARLLTASALLLAVCLPLRAGQAPASVAPQQPAFRSGVELVRLDIRVTDANGLPVPDLRADEVEVVEAGEVRPVLFFQHIEEPAGGYVDAARRTVAAEVSTNQGAPRGHVYVLVFDQSHIRPGNEQKARIAAQRFLRMRVKPGDRVALYSVPGPGPSISFTSDITRVIREMVAVRGAREDPVPGQVPMRVYDAYQITRGVESVLNRYVSQYSNSATGTDARPTGLRAAQARGADELDALRLVVQENARSVVARADEDSRQFLLRLSDVVRELRAVEGRKAVILFSEGFQIDNVRHELEIVAAAAAQSYSVIYALDLNSRAVGAEEMTPRGGEQYSEILGRLEPLGSLTAETDGLLFNDASQQLDRVFNQIADTSQDYYLVGFAPTEAALSDRGRYSRIRVVVKRPGVRVSGRTGYAVGRPPAAGDRRRAVEAALAAPFSQQGLRIEYTTYALRGSAPDVQRVILSLAVGLPIGRPEAKPADVAFAVRNVKTGRIAASGSDALPLPEATSAGSTTGVGYYRAQMDLPAGIYMMRTVVREPGGLVGSADRRFQVRPLSGPGVQAGDLVLGSSDVKGLPVRAMVYESETIGGVIETYARSAAMLTSVGITAELVPFGQSTALTTGRADLDAITAGPHGASRGARIEIPTQGIPPGEYVVRAVVKAGRENAAELLREVTISAGARPAPAAAVQQPVDPAVVMSGDVAAQFRRRVRERSAGGTDPFAASAELGFTRFTQRDYPGAVAAWKACLEQEPSNAPAAFLLGWAYAAAGNDTGAVAAWRAAIVADPALVPAYLAAIDAYLRLGSPDLALQLARSGLAVLPASVELRDRVQRLERR